MTSRSRFQRKTGNRPYRKLFAISVEGRRTEPHYFAMLGRLCQGTIIKCLPTRFGTSPTGVLKTMREWIKRESLRPNDEAWIVVDRDQWDVKEIEAVYAWAGEAPNRGLAVSNPNFEYWLLLHYEDCGCQNDRDCIARLRKHVPRYDKKPDTSKPVRDGIRAAMERAARRYDPSARGWPMNPGETTVYILVGRILQAAGLVDR